MLFSTPFAQITNPDLGFQLSICVNAMAERLILDAVTGLLTTPIPVGMRMFTPVAPGTPLDSRATCTSNTERIAVWFPNAAAAGRDMALRLPTKLLSGENYVQEISLGGIRFIADRVWNDPQTPRRIRLPDPFADARLTTLEINLVPPNRITTRINGVVPIAVLPDVRFSITFTDTLSLAGGRVVCTPSTPQVDVTGGPLLPLLRNVAIPFITVALGRAGSMEGLGCLVLRSMAPGSITVPVAGRIDFPYSRLDLNTNGVILGSRAPLPAALMAVRVMEEPFRAPR